MPIVKIEDVRDAWSACHVHLEDFDSEVRKRFKGQWRKWLDKGISIIDKNGRAICEICLIQKGGKLYPEVKREKHLTNLYAGMLVYVLRNLIKKEGK